uniref:Uncharacterized protein n=1 Tax=Anguilla anguilla TaxID=7936 RepID=A0A0E9U271_ANGAN
MNNCSFTYTLD